MTENSTYEVRPLTSRVGRAKSTGRQERTPHVIRRAPPPPSPMDDDRPLRHTARRPRILPKKPSPSSYTIEIALFLDQAAYKLFYPHLNYNEADLRDMLLAYINGVSFFNILQFVFLSDQFQK